MKNFLLSALVFVFGATLATAARSILLSEVAAGNGGFKIIGEAPTDLAGRSVGSTGDMNEDGIAELILGAHRNAAIGVEAGAAYIVFGKTDTQAVALADVATGNGGFKILGEAAGDLAGFAITAAGDVDDDGVPDVILGATRNDAGGLDAGAAYVVFGKSDTAPVHLAAVAAGSGGFKIVGEADGDKAGFSVSSVGDMSGDGIPEVIVGAREHDGAGDNTGAAYVVFGKADTALVDLGDVSAGVGGFKIVGESPGDEAGWSVGSCGDMNGDHIPEVVVGAIYNHAGSQIEAGAAYVVFGKANTTAVNLGDVAAGSGGFKISGEDPYDRAGSWVASIADLNGDGLPEVLSGGIGNGAGANLGAAYVVFGKSDTAGVDLDDVAIGVGGYKIVGEARLDEAGDFLASVDDTNGDGLPEVLVGAVFNDEGGENAGAVYEVFGKTDTAAVDLGVVASGVGGFKIIGEAAGDEARSVVAADDINDDRIPDLIVGSIFNAAGGTNAGAAYVVFGPRVTPPGRMPPTIRAGRITEDRIRISWSASTCAGASGYGIYEGELGNWYTHTAIVCSEADADSTAEVDASFGDRYYLVVPTIPDSEGSYGLDSHGSERPPGFAVCKPNHDVTPCSAPAD